MKNNINTKEQWAWITGYEGKYMVSTFGQVKSFLRDKINGRLLKPGNDGNGYKQVILCKDGKITKAYVHRLVAIAFIPNVENKPQVNHIDEDKANNNITNLEWMTAKENINHGTRTKRISEKTQKAVRNVTTGVIYESLTIAATELGLFTTNISSCCRGSRKTCGGYVWEYVQE